MAISEFFLMHEAQRRIGLGEINLETDSFDLVLLGDGQALTPDFVGASGDCTYADLTDEVPGGVSPDNGYTTGGEPLVNPTWFYDTPFQRFDAEDVTFADLTADVKYAAIIDRTTADDAILGYVDLDEAEPTGRAFAAQDCVFVWNTDGIFSLRQNPPT